MKHLDEVGETYWEHMRAALAITGRLALATHCQLLHAVFPFIKPPLENDLESLIKFLENRLTKVKIDEEEEELYTIYGGD
tara:strand:+ start:2283 stop:2522 length:240 start_codon:yes stop_codon:yes gene_type:complete